MLGPDVMVMVAFAVLSIAACCIIGVIPGWPVSQWISDKISSFFLGLSTERFDKPQPLIGNAASKAIKGDVTGALTDYKKMLKSHPKNAELYLRIMELAYGPLQRPDIGDEVLTAALKKIESKKERKMLKRLGTALKEGKHLGWLNNLERGIQPPLLHLGEAAIVGTSKKR